MHERPEDFTISNVAEPKGNAKPDASTRRRRPDGSSRAAASSPSPLTPAARLWMRFRTAEALKEEERKEVLDELFFEGPEWIPFVKRFTVLVVLSTAIAAFGLIADSSAVVIGAMLVAPLMTPILAVAAAIVYAQMKRLLVSALVLAFGTLGAVAFGWLIAVLTSRALTEEDLSDQLLARTSPSLIDLGIAVAAGLAAGYVLTHKRAGSSLPGVAIAVALVPPLATAGVTLEVGAMSDVKGALLLYGTNMVAIVFAAGVVMLATGFVPNHVRALVKGRIRFGLVVTVIALVLLTVPLAIHTLAVIEDEQFTRRVVDAVDVWDPQARIVSLEADAGRQQGTVDLVVSSAGLPEPAWRLAEMVAAATGRDIDVTVKYQQEIRDAASTR